MQDTEHTELLNAAKAMRHEGRFEDALAYSESLRASFQSEPYHYRRLLNGLGLTHYELYDYEQAAICYAEALEIHTDDEDEELQRAFLEGNLADTLVALDRTAEAHALLGRAERVMTGVWLADRLETRARAHFTDGRFREAAIAAGEALNLALKGDEEKTLALAWKTLNKCFEAYQSEAKQ